MKHPEYNSLQKRALVEAVARLDSALRWLTEAGAPDDFKERVSALKHELRPYLPVKRETWTPGSITTPTQGEGR